MTKGRKKISDESKRLRGTDQPCRMDGELALYQDMMRDLEKEGVTIEVATKAGTVTQINPKRKIAENALVAAKTLASEFGISPASRARVAAMIAGIVASIMALGEWMTAQGDEDANPYQNRGMLSLND